MCLGNCSCYKPKGVAADRDIKIGDHPAAMLTLSFKDSSLSACLQKALSPCLLCVVLLGGGCKCRQSPLSRSQRPAADRRSVQPPVTELRSLHCAGKLKCKRMPASISCGKQRKRGSILLPRCGCSEASFHEKRNPLPVSAG